MKGFKGEIRFEKIIAHYEQGHGNSLRIKSHALEISFQSLHFSNL